MNNNHSNLTKIIVVFIAKAMKGVGALLLTYVLAKKYGAYGSGLFFISYTFAFLCAQFAQLGIGNSCLKYAPVLKNDDPQNLSFLWTASQAIVGSFAALFLIVIFFSSSFISTLVFKDPDNYKYILCASPIILFWALAKINIYFRQSLGDMSGITFVENLMIPLGMLLIAGASYVVDISVLNFVSAVSFLFFLAFIYSFYSTKRVYSLKFNMSFTGPVTVKDMLVYSVPLLIIAFSQNSLMWINTLILGGIGSVVDSAVYVAAMKVAMSISILLYTFNSVYAPQISSAYAKKDFESIKNLYGDVTRSLSFFSFLFLAGVALYSDYIMATFGAEYLVGTNCLLFLLLGQIFNCYTGPVGYILILSGQSKLEVVNTVAGLCLNAALCFVFYRSFGVSGAGLAFCVSNALINLLRYLQCRHLFGLRWLSKVQAGFFGLQVLLVITFVVLTAFDVNRELIAVTLGSTYLLVNFRSIKKLWINLKVTHAV